LAFAVGTTGRSFTVRRTDTKHQVLEGGPNAQGAGVPHTFPARAYRDQSELYGVNEPAIYWTAAVAHALALAQVAQ
jgi:hypothetical protein